MAGVALRHAKPHYATRCSGATLIRTARRCPHAARGGEPAHIRAMRHPSEKGEVLLRGVGTLRYVFLPNASVQWQPDGLTIHTKKWLLGAGFIGAPPISPSRGRILA